MMKILPSGTTLAELEEKAAEYEREAECAAEPVATELREKARLCREWITSLETGAWSS
jgi:hypothetical protein